MAQEDDRERRSVSVQGAYPSSPSAGKGSSQGCPLASCSPILAPTATLCGEGEGQEEYTLRRASLEPLSRALANGAPYTGPTSFTPYGGSVLVGSEIMVLTVADYRVFCVCFGIDDTPMSPLLWSEVVRAMQALGFTYTRLRHYGTHFVPPDDLTLRVLKVSKHKEHWMGEKEIRR
ncbi:hypothetical protein C8Q76DRAFT_697193 [Earliella scabrosa]|nr:hypothetical protein C8Q76DRAFT_697193 [Earliella scabrosa]